MAGISKHINHVSCCLIFKAILGDSLYEYPILQMGKNVSKRSKWQSRRKILTQAVWFQSPCCSPPYSMDSACSMFYMILSFDSECMIPKDKGISFSVTFP